MRTNVAPPPLRLYRFALECSQVTALHKHAFIYARSAQDALALYQHLHSWGGQHATLQHGDICIRGEWFPVLSISISKGGARPDGKHLELVPLPSTSERVRH